MQRAVTFKSPRTASVLIDPQSATLEDRVEFAQLIKVYRAGEAWYSPAEVSKMEVVPVIGRPDPEPICTSIVERQNLSVRMGTPIYPPD